MVIILRIITHYINTCISMEKENLYFFIMLFAKISLRLLLLLLYSIDALLNGGLVSY